MKSKVLEKVVYIDEDGEICLCDADFRKTCVARIANDLPCHESIVRVTPVDRSVDDDSDISLNCVDPELKKITSEFSKTLRHFDKMR